MADFRLLIGGERVAGARGTYAIVNPATEEVVGQAPEASVEQVEAAAEAAAAAFPAWSRTKPEHRAELLNRAADLLRERMDELIPLVQAETGATLRVDPDHAGAHVRRTAPPLRQGRPRADHDPAAAERDALDRAGRRRPHGRPWSCASRSASSPASPPTTSRSSTWPARSAPPSPWATPSS